MAKFFIFSRDVRLVESVLSSLQTKGADLGIIHLEDISTLVPVRVEDIFGLR